MTDIIDVRPVRSARERRVFLTFPWRIYKDDPLWVPPLLKDRAEAIDPARGDFFKRGDAECFVAWRGGRPVGTICAGEDRFTNENRGLRECVFGFFDYIDDDAVAGALVNRVIVWARARGLDALFGPFNLDYENGYGVLLEGRDRPPALLCGHTPPYYKGFMDRYGFGPARGDNIALAAEIAEETPAYRRVARLAESVSRRRDIDIRTPDLDHWDAEIDRIHHLLNAALAHLPDHIGWHRSAVEALLAPFRTIADMDLILFADVDGETVGFLPGVPNLNEILIHANGLRYPWDYLRVLRYKNRQPKCLAIKSVLILPEYWGTGVAAVLGAEMIKRARAKGYTWLDLSITSEDNPQTPLIGEHMGAKVYKRWRVYRLRLDE
ncbi:MAG: GNAT family N-acetyltransferase [Anaerolineae bacterium]|nr:GNAT family N-acetyltransferase [Anaerolineae bacterium]